MRTTYADSQQIVFVDCAVALELAADHLEYYDRQGRDDLGDLGDLECVEQLSDDDNFLQPTAAPREKRPSLEHTVTFVKDHLDVMVRPANASCPSDSALYPSPPFVEHTSSINEVHSLAVRNCKPGLKRAGANG